MVCFGTTTWTQQKCAKLCHGILASVAISARVVVGTLGVRIPLVPAQFAQQGRCGRLVGAAAICLHEPWYLTFC